MTLSVNLPPAKWPPIVRPIGLTRDRWGGFQHLIHRLQSDLRPQPDGSAVLKITREDAERLIHYAQDFGQGTYQSQLRAIVPEVKQALDELPPPPETGSLFGDDDDE